MMLSKNAKIIIIVSSILVVSAAIVTPTSVVLINKKNTIDFTLLYNAGVMIEAGGTRIYIDPIDLPFDYRNYPADAILITHDHSDHYQESRINFLKTNDTLIVFPAIMTSAISIYDGLGVVPGDSFQVGPFEISCFYMYTFAPPGYDSSHPIESNYTSYIIKYNDFTIFHAGDSSNIPEYTELTGLIDVALLPLGPGCQTMTGEDVVLAIDTIRPSYFVPIHYAVGMNIEFIETYGSAIENCNCELLNLSYYDSYQFKI